MKNFIYLILLFTFLVKIVNAEDFVVEAKKLATDLKTSLMKNLNEQIAKNGTIKAISFCHTNVKPIAKNAAGSRTQQIEFGRTSHKLRNENNRAIPLMEPYLKEFAGTFKGDLKKEYVVIKDNVGKQIFLEPLYLQAACLQCHGQQINPDVQKKISELYPKDQATNFKLNEFRGFIWIKEI